MSSPDPTRGAAPGDGLPHPDFHPIPSRNGATTQIYAGMRKQYVPHIVELDELFDYTALRELRKKAGY
jgi:hypothetical protein